MISSVSTVIKPPLPRGSLWTVLLFILGLWETRVTTRYRGRNGLERRSVSKKLFPLSPTSGLSQCECSRVRKILYTDLVIFGMTSKTYSRVLVRGGTVCFVETKVVTLIFGG